MEGFSLAKGFILLAVVVALVIAIAVLSFGGVQEAIDSVRAYLTSQFGWSF